MGTTADKLQAVLNAKNAIKAKFNLSDNLPFSKYAENIKTDIIGGEDVDLSFITATAADILEGKVSVDTIGNQVIGTLQKGTDVSATTANAPDVLNGKKFYNSAGVLTTGTLVPQSGGGGSTDFYKCAAIGEADSGSTTDLPEPVFYAPLTEQKSTAETGQALTYNGNVQFTEVDGVKCAYFQRGGIYSTSGLDIFNGLTVATKVRLTSTSDSNTYFYFGDTEMNSLGLWSSGGSFELGSVGKASGGTIFAFSHNIQTNVCYDFAVVYDGSELAFYIDGVLVYSGAWAYDVSTAFIGIGCYKANGNIFSYSSNYQTGFRVFNQAMTAEQVKKLYDPNFEPLEPFTWNGYKAVLVEQTTTTEGETVVVVSGAGTTEANGIYKLMDSSATGTSRVWKHKSAEYDIRWASVYWSIFDSTSQEIYCQSIGAEEPWADSWTYLFGATPAPTVAQQTTEGTSETKKYYTFEETLTKGLTYGKGFTPVVDYVYDAEAMVRAVLCEQNKYPEIASPMDMTGYTKDDWVVSESDYRFASTKAWNGFYPNGIWAGDDWLQWQNTAQQVLIRQLTFGYGGNSNWIYSCRLDGSDDGEHWTEIGTRDCEYEGEENETILTYPENETAYYYHRLVVTSSQGCAVVQNLLAKRDIDGRNIP